ncbi:hypothetical protein E1A91_D02G176300v1 [Gossypium mustelinum]|uniref:Photosystem I P700 chlorophyll a apoprotein A1 n=1 Tax=Gossypium mustelinum TaxID=34275 RepID=A0A5D2VXN0_GOSMU|nr:hypothetical protein E1A91_D02G176300v1 [Gossypium mustelinum]
MMFITLISDRKLNREGFDRDNNLLAHDGETSQVIQSYGSLLSTYDLLFLGAHFEWVFSLTCLFSGHGYWQELIESIVWDHNKVKVAPTTQPRALSIVQRRVVGVTHYLLGGISTTWAFFLIKG